MTHSTSDAAAVVLEYDVPARTADLYARLRDRGVSVVRLGPGWLRVPGRTVTVLSCGGIQWRGTDGVRQVPVVEYSMSKAAAALAAGGRLSPWWVR